MHAAKISYIHPCGGVPGAEATQWLHKYTHGVDSRRPTLATATAEVLSIPAVRRRCNHWRSVAREGQIQAMKLLGPVVLKVPTHVMEMG